MANPNRTENPAAFTAAKLALLSISDPPPLHQPHSADAWSRFEAQRRFRNPSRRTRQKWTATAATAAATGLLLILAAGPARSLAQSLWRSVILRETRIVMLDAAQISPALLLPNVFPMAPPGPSEHPATRELAEQLTGFPIAVIHAPHQPPDQPRFRVEQPRVIDYAVDLDRIARELARLSRPPVAPPAGLRTGDVITLRPQGRMAVTSYGECPPIPGPWRACAFLVQSRPRILDLPAGVDPLAFERYALALAALDPAQASGRLQFLPAETPASIEPVRLSGGRGSSLMRYSEGVAYVLEWQQQGFWFTLFARGPEFAIALAESIR